MNQNKNLYLISGLGADKRAYQNLDLSQFQFQHLDWLAPNRNEELSVYAKRFSKLIVHDQPIIVGLSFGGIVAIEVAKHIPDSKLILISSIKTKFELPKIYRFFGALRVNKLVPSFLFKRNKWLLIKAFGIKDKASKRLLKAIINETDAAFLKWAIDKIVHWNNEKLPDRISHIHGTSDKIFPISNISDVVTVNGGGHFMVFDRADEVTELLHQAILKD
ncbi:MAG: alpha/beta hydrolase [Fulvivirga sp.]|uniref:alpha/beta fold hydrolase n=1 Tax=Fulvivirga sp. TaxID=1931237 RepID=UPI0032F2E0DF